MTTPLSLRLSLSIVLGFYSSALLAPTSFALTSSEVDSLTTKAARGSASAQYTLGLALADPREPAYDPAQAYVWLGLASLNGTTSKAFSTLTQQLSPTELAEGKRRLEAAIADPVSPAISPIAPSAESNAASPVFSRPPAPASTPAPDKPGTELAAAHNEKELAKAELTAQLADTRKRIAIAEAALQSKDREITRLSARLNDANSTLTAPLPATAELISLRNESDQLLGSANASASALAELRAKLSTTTAELNAQREKLELLGTDLAVARRAQALAEADLASLTTRLTEATRLATKAQADLTAQLTQATTESAGLRSQITPLQAAASASGPELTNLRAQLAAATQAAATSAKAHDSPALTAELAALPTQLAAAQATIEEQRTGLSQAVENLAGARKTIGLITADLVAVQDLLREARTPNAPAQSPMPAQVPPAELEAAARLAELEKAKMTSATQLATSLRSFTVQQAEITRLQTALASINDECLATGAKLASASSELSALRSQAATASVAAAEADNLRAQLAAARRAAAEQSAAAAAASAGLADARKTVDAATAELVTTRDQLRQTQATAEASAIELQQIKTRLALAGSLPAGNTPSRPAPFPTITLNLQPARPTAPFAQPPAVKPETPAVAAARYHTVGTGDTLTRIAKQYYGNAGRWNDILDANREVIRNPDNLAPGTKLRIP